MSDVSESLRSLTKNERPWGNRSGRSPKMSEWANRSFFWANRSFAHFFPKNEQVAQKTDEPIPSPGRILCNLSILCSVHYCTLYTMYNVLCTVYLHPPMVAKWNFDMKYCTAKQTRIAFDMDPVLRVKFYRKIERNKRNLKPNISYPFSPPPLSPSLSALVPSNLSVLWP